MNFLIVSNFYYPYSGVASKRMTALSSFLTSKGHTVFVVKARNREYGKSVTHTIRKSPETIYEIDHCHDNLILKKMMRSRLFYNKSKYVIDQNTIDVMIVSCGPFNYLSACTRLKKKNPQIKYIVDFRDILDGTQCRNGRTSLLQKIGYYSDIKRERAAVKKSDLCLVVSNLMESTYRDRYSAYSSKFKCIRNGYDDITMDQNTIETIKNHASMKHFREDSEGLKIAIFGKYGFYDDSFYAMLSKAVSQIRGKGIGVVITQFGEKEEKLRRAFADQNISECYRFVETEGYEKDLIKLTQFDAFIASNFLKEALGTKIFDYIWLNRPIITINPHQDSEQAILTKEFENGFYCANSDDISAAIESIANMNEIYLDRDVEKRSQYGRLNQFEKLLEGILRM